MANIGGKSAAIYSPVDKQKLDNNNFDDYEHWNGESFYIENNQLHIKDNGFISQKVTGANNNEIWLLSADGKGSFTISLTFVDYDNNAIYTTSENCSNDRIRYFSTYGVAPKGANGVLVRVKGEGTIDSINLQHLKALAVLSDWYGALRSKEDETFQGKHDKFFKGEAESVRYLDSIPNTEVFQEKEKIFIGFLSNKSLFNRIEGRISKINNLENDSMPVRFRCNEIKIPFKE